MKIPPTIVIAIVSAQGISFISFKTQVLVDSCYQDKELKCFIRSTDL